MTPTSLETASAAAPRAPGATGGRAPDLVRDTDLLALALSGAASSRRRARRSHEAICRALPHTCRLAVVPTVHSCGSTSLAVQLTGALVRARLLPGTLVAASPGPADASAHLPFHVTWDNGLSAPTTTGTTTTAPAPTSPVGATEAGADLRRGASPGTGLPTGPDGLTSCLRLPAVGDTLPDRWAHAHAELSTLPDTWVVETGSLAAEEIGELARARHVIVLVSPARRRQVERGRALVAELSGAMRRLGSPAVLHAVVAVAPGRPPLPRLGPGETLVPHDPALAGAPGPMPLRRRTAAAICEIAAAAVEATGSSHRRGETP
ncbi:MAG: hypothetical protein Q4C85_11115 [Actinomyces sp.]|uniref:hypothetical protein n=1 Tax=Actinomyces sp. TaxID=29317 RepID=UPI0026DAC8D6|nr:hypothetical protein [Actinomyces sp.]MDO4244282.1 hypothetical protein [Actinomyces sp.]